MSFTTHQHEGHPDVIMKTVAGLVRIPNGQRVAVLRASGPLDFQVKYEGYIGTVKQANLQLQVPSTVIAMSPDPKISEVFLWRGGVRQGVQNGTSLPVARVEINVQGLFYIVIHDGREYSVKQENVQPVIALATPPAAAVSPGAAGYHVASPGMHHAAAPKAVGKGKWKAKEGKGVSFDPIVLAAATSVRAAEEREKRRRKEKGLPEGADGASQTWTQYNGSVLEPALTVVDGLGESPVRLVDARFIVELAKRNGRLSRRQDLPEEVFIDLEQLRSMHAGWRANCLRVVAVSHPWQQPDHPDPKGINLQILAGVLSFFLHASGGTYAVFLDFLSVCQKGLKLEERTPEEWRLFSLALRNMMDWYAHPKILTFKLTQLPHGYPSGFVFPDGNPPNIASYFDRGWCYCESSLSNLTKDNDLVLDLGKISGKQIYCLEKLITECSADRHPPISPEAFEVQLKTKAFTSKAADFDKVSNLYKNTFKAQLGVTKMLKFRSWGWCDDELAVLAQTCAVEVLPNLQILYLSGNRIGDTGCTALAQACAAGALPNLQTLYLDSNQIGDAGCTALAHTFAAGALPNLQTLLLYNNYIGDAGCTALAQACAAGALPNLQSLYLQANRLGDAGCTALAHAFAAGALPNLQTLSLRILDTLADWDSNQIGDAGCTALAQACAAGALPNLQCLNLQNTPCRRLSRYLRYRAIVNAHCSIC